jgi:hypothetical protein
MEIKKFNPFRVAALFALFPMGYHPWLFKLNPSRVYRNKSNKDLNTNNIRCNQRY